MCHLRKNPNFSNPIHCALPVLPTSQSATSTVVSLNKVQVCEKACVCLCIWFNCRLREREERCRRREPRCDDLQLGRLQERLSERDQLIKRLVVRKKNTFSPAKNVTPETSTFRTVNISAIVDLQSRKSLIFLVSDFFFTCLKWSQMSCIPWGLKKTMKQTQTALWCFYVNIYFT